MGGAQKARFQDVTGRTDSAIGKYYRTLQGMAFDRQNPLKGRDHLRRFQVYYQAVQRVAKRNNLRPTDVIFLCNTYLEESGHDVDKFERVARDKQQKRLNGLTFIDDKGQTQITPEGWRIVLQVIYALKNTFDLKRTKAHRGIK